MAHHGGGCAEIKPGGLWAAAPSPGSKWNPGPVGEGGGQAPPVPPSPLRAARNPGNATSCAAAGGLTWDPRERGFALWETQRQLRLWVTRGHAFPLAALARARAWSSEILGGR